MKKVATVLAFCVFAWLVTTSAAVADDYSFDFDVSEYKKKPFEYSGNLEMIFEHVNLNRKSVLFRLNYMDKTPRSVINRLVGSFELETLYRWDSTKFTMVARSGAFWDADNTEGDITLSQGYITHQPNARFSFDVGKKVLKWGKGYAFTPVGFVERRKDPNDPDLSREGYYLLTANFTHSSDGDLKTISLTPVILPVYDDMNQEYGEDDHTNFAIKLYMLYLDTDIDLLFLSDGSGSARAGVDFSRNILSNLEVHGEYVIAFDQPKPSIDESGDVTYQNTDRDTYLMGLRYLSENNITTIAEYYHNGAGFTPDEMGSFYRFTETAMDAYDAGDASQIQPAKNAARSGFQAPNPMRNYIYVRSSLKEPEDILYFTPSVNLLYNMDDWTFSITPELFYSGLEDANVRLRFSYLWGGRYEEFGEKQNNWKIDFRYNKYL